MKIVILNDSFFSEEHLAQLRELGEVTFHPLTQNTQEGISRTGDADIVIADQFILDLNKEYFKNVPNLKLLALNTTTFSMVDLIAATERGIKVANVPGFSKRSVAELAIGLMFDVVRRITYGDKKYRKNTAEPDLTSSDAQEMIGYNLEGKTLGVIGLGRIGTEIASIAQGIGMKAIGWDRKNKNSIEQVELKELLSRSDIVVMALAYSEETKLTLSRELLSLLKANAVFINVGMGELVDMEALHDILKEEKIKGAAFDIAHLTDGHPMLSLNNVVFTPHIGSYTKESFYENLPNMIVENVKNFVKGTPSNIVS